VQLIFRKLPAVRNQLQAAITFDQIPATANLSNADKSLQPDTAAPCVGKRSKVQVYG
jgi:hypothetical protein